MSDRIDRFRYVIVDYDNITDQMVSETECAGKEYIYVSHSGTKRGILRYVVNSKPSSLTGITSYTHSEIVSITEDPDGDWYVAQSPAPEIP